MGRGRRKRARRGGMRRAAFVLLVALAIFIAMLLLDTAVVLRLVFGSLSGSVSGSPFWGCLVAVLLGSVGVWLIWAAPEPKPRRRGATRRKRVVAQSADVMEPDRAVDVKPRACRPRKQPATPRQAQPFQT